MRRIDLINYADVILKVVKVPKLVNQAIIKLLKFFSSELHAYSLCHMHCKYKTYSNGRAVNSLMGSATFENYKQNKNPLLAKNKN